MVASFNQARSPVMVSSVTQTRDALPDYSFAPDFYTKYEIKDVLGRGVSSIVRRCVEKQTCRELAVKIIELVNEGNTSHFYTEEFHQATAREINILGQCANHPHIVSLYDTFQSESYIFLVFEICSNGELFDLLTQVVNLNELRTRQIMRQLLLAVEYIHSKNIVHRDLKPENILFDSQYNIKVSDFGFAVVSTEDYELTELCGTPGYLAPEILKVSMYDDAPGYGKPVDLWACGVIMYTMLVGCPPFWHHNQTLMLKAILLGRYTYNSPQWNDISDASRDLISKLLVVNPRHRFTASQSLNHAFFKRDDTTGSVAECVHRVPSVRTLNCTTSMSNSRPVGRHRFRVYVWTVIAVHWFAGLRTTCMRLDTLRVSPYSVRGVRRMIDAAAFRVYGHWLHKEDCLNRGALFENTAPKLHFKMAANRSSQETQLEHCALFAPQVEVKERRRKTGNVTLGLLHDVIPGT